MKILLDECVPKKFKDHLAQYEVWTVPQAGWAGKKNGALLNLAAGQFPVFITVDKDLPHQQNIQGLEIMVVVLATANNDLESLLPYARRMILAAAQPSSTSAERISQLYREP